MSSAEEKRASEKKGGYRSKIGGRSTVINRTSAVGMPMIGGYGGGMSSSRSSMSFSSGPAPLAHGTYSTISNEGIKTVKQGRDKEKKELQGLNERLAGHIEKTRFLEAQNKQCLMEIERLKKAKGFDVDKLKSMYEEELKCARECIDDLGKAKAELDAEVAGHEDELEFEQNARKEAEKLADDLRARLDKLGNHVGDMEGEMKRLTLQNDNLNKDNANLRGTNERLKADLKRLRMDLDNETAAHIEAAGRAQTSEEARQFDLEVFNTQLAEMKALLDADHSQETQDMWKGELSKAVREIQSEFDRQLDVIRGDCEMRMETQLRDIRAGSTRDNAESSTMKTENTRLKTKITDLTGKLNDLQSENARLLANERALKSQIEELRKELEDCNRDHKEAMADVQQELESVLAQMQTLMDAKMTLELEICCYRGLLEGEENRTGLQDLVSHETNTRTSGGQTMADLMAGSQSQMPTSNYESTGRCTVQRTSKGILSIYEASPDGAYVSIENTATGARKKTQDLNGWCIRREGQGGNKVDFKFTGRNKTELAPDRQCKIFAKGSAPSRLKDGDLVTDFMSWGQGTCTYSLLDDEGNQKATLTCKFS